MNVSELFFFKTIPCNKGHSHSPEACYFYHKDQDRRRVIIDIEDFIQSYANVELTEDSLYGFNTSENKLNYYNETMGFENIDNKILCRNKYEFCYHILNYKTEKCPYEEIGIVCPLGKLCYYEHTDDKEITNEALNLFRDFIINIASKHIFISLKEIILTYYSIIKETNIFIEQKDYAKYMEKLSHFSTYLNDNIVEINNNEKESQISEIIVKELTTKTEVHLGDNFYSQFNIHETDLLYAMNTFPIREDLVRVIIAMLNSSDGYIIYGVNINTGNINGIKISRHERDKFRRWFNNQFESQLIEFEDHIKYKFYDSEKYNVCVLVIRITKVKNENLVCVSANYENNYNENGKCFIIKENSLEKIKNKQQISIKNDDIKELSRKEYIEELREKLIDHYTKKFSAKY